MSQPGLPSGLALIQLGACPRELRQLSAGPRRQELSEADVDAIMLLADSDGDGSVEYKEFVRMGEVTSNLQLELTELRATVGEHNTAASAELARQSEVGPGNAFQPLYTTSYPLTRFSDFGLHRSARHQSGSRLAPSPHGEAVLLV